MKKQKETFKKEPWDPYLEKRPNAMRERQNRPYKVDYEKAIQNLTDILVDSFKMEEMNANVFLALDEDNSGTLSVPLVVTFCSDFLKGHQVEGYPDSDFEREHRTSLNELANQESEEMNSEELSKFLNELLKDQIKYL